MRLFGGFSSYNNHSCQNTKHLSYSIVVIIENLFYVQVQLANKTLYRHCLLQA
jgi:hypothetical protein